MGIFRTNAPLGSPLNIVFFNEVQHLLLRVAHGITQGAQIFAFLGVFLALNDPVVIRPLVATFVLPKISFNI